MRHRLTVLLLLVVLLAVPAGAAPANAASPVFPDQITLPPGFAPEGIAVGRGSTFYVGSIPTGAIYGGDLRTGRGDILVPATEGRAAIGVKEAGGILWVAGGPTGMAFLYDAKTGADIAQVPLTPAPALINDVVVTRDAAYFTDSGIPFIFRVDRDTLEVTSIPLTGDIVYGPGFNANGIEATPDGKTLVLVQSNTGKLFTVDPVTGVTDEIELTGGDAAFGDGLLLVGHTLYVVQNFSNLVARIDLSPDRSSGVVVSQTGNPGFDIPSTVARFGNRLYVVNARFTTPPGPTTTYDVIGLPRP